MNQLVGYPFYVAISSNFFDYCQMSVKQVLGAGMSSDVVLAQSAIKTDYYMAVKVLNLGTDTDQKNELFSNEMRAMQICQHRHIMKAAYAYRDPTCLYICMDYYPLGSLNKYIKNLNYARTELFLVQLASALKHMHRNRIAHIDIKLPNILLRTTDDLLLADFGLCCRVPEGVDEVLAISVGGTETYMAPEKLNSDFNGTVCPLKMDMYSLGAVLQAMIYGMDPDIPGDECVRPSSGYPVPELLMFCLVNLLEEEPAERFSSTQLMDTLLERSQWKTYAQELELNYNSVQKTPSQICADYLEATKRQLRELSPYKAVETLNLPQEYRW